MRRTCNSNPQHAGVLQYVTTSIQLCGFKNKSVYSVNTFTGRDELCVQQPVPAGQVFEYTHAENCGQAG